MTTAVLSKDGKSLTIHLALTFRKSGHRKRIVAPDGAPVWAPTPAAPNSVLITAIARAHRWKGMMENGEFATLGDLAKSESINFSYVCRILRLSLLSPKIIEAVLDGRQPAARELRDLLECRSLVWSEQEASALR